MLMILEYLQAIDLRYSEETGKDSIVFGSTSNGGYVSSGNKVMLSMLKSLTIIRGEK